jgi:Mrp family chromosome partitioning ATPase
MVVRAGLAGHNTIERAIEALPANRILGVILNGADQISEVGYYGYYGYGYNYARGRRGRFDWRSLLRLGRGGQAKQP